MFPCEMARYIAGFLRYARKLARIRGYFGLKGPGLAPISRLTALPSVYHVPVGPAIGPKARIPRCAATLLARRRLRVTSRASTEPMIGACKASRHRSCEHPLDHSDRDESLRAIDELRKNL